ncbi:MAG TPA: hypothetical protein VMV29_02125 [Ktedonobacterales bacterium]|nr:hypothetical protein [Ktedonobacterales bacterium]
MPPEPLTPPEPTPNPHDPERLNTDRERTSSEDAILRRVQQSLTRDAIRDAVLAVAEALEPDGQYDPEDDPRPPQAVHQLAQLLEDPLVAESIAAALRTLWMRWRLGEAAP